MKDKWDLDFLEKKLNNIEKDINESNKSFKDIIMNIAKKDETKESYSLLFDELNEDEAFKNYLGAILQYIITDSLEWGEKNNIARIGIGNNEPTTDTHTEPSSE